MELKNKSMPNKQKPSRKSHTISNRHVQKRVHVRLAVLHRFGSSQERHSASNSAGVHAAMGGQRLDARPRQGGNNPCGQRLDATPRHGGCKDWSVHTQCPSRTRLRERQPLQSQWGHRVHVTPRFLPNQKSRRTAGILLPSGRRHSPAGRHAASHTSGASTALPANPSRDTRRHARWSAAQTLDIEPGCLIGNASARGTRVTEHARVTRQRPTVREAGGSDGWQCWRPYTWPRQSAKGVQHPPHRRLLQPCARC